MGTVIPFPARRLTKPRPRMAGGCHVVIFPGVRIEREANRRVGFLRRPAKPADDGRRTPTKSA